MAKKNNTKRAKRGAGSFRKYDNGLYEYRITYLTNHTENHFVEKAKLYVLPKQRNFCTSRKCGVSGSTLILRYRRS